MWQIKLPVAAHALGIYWERFEHSLTYLSFASFNAPYVWKKNSWHSIFDTAPYNPENTVLISPLRGSLSVWQRMGSSPMDWLWAHGTEFYLSLVWLWDATVVDTFARCHYKDSARQAGTVARGWSCRMPKIYDLFNNYCFQPVIIETTCVYGKSTTPLLHSLAKKLVDMFMSGDPQGETVVTPVPVRSRGQKECCQHIVDYVQVWPDFGSPQRTDQYYLLSATCLYFSAYCI